MSMKRRATRPYARLRVMAEYGSSGIWVAEQTGLFRHGMVEHATLALPPALAARFDAWIDAYTEGLERPLDDVAFNAEGMSLARALKAHCGAATEVVYAGERRDGGLLPEERVEDGAGEERGGDGSPRG